MSLPKPIEVLACREHFFACVFFLNFSFCANLFPIFFLLHFFHSNIWQLSSRGKDWGRRNKENISCEFHNWNQAHDHQRKLTLSSVSKITLLSPLQELFGVVLGAITLRVSSIHNPSNIWFITEGRNCGQRQRNTIILFLFSTVFLCRFPSTPFSLISPHNTYRITCKHSIKEIKQGIFILPKTIFTVQMISLWESWPQLLPDMKQMDKYVLC